MKYVGRTKTMLNFQIKVKHNSEFNKNNNLTRFKQKSELDGFLERNFEIYPNGSN